MRFAVIFLLAAVACGLGAMSLGGWGWLLLWPAVAFLGVVAAYAGGGPRLLGKRDDGSRSLWAIVVFLPYLAMMWATWQLVVLISREPACHEVVPGLWLGRRLRVREIPEGVTVIVDLTAEFSVPTAVRVGRTYVCVPTLDASVPTSDALRALVERIVACSEPVLVHCAAGHGRSALVVVCVLLARRLAADVADAERIVKEVRPRIGLTSAQRRQAAEFHKGLS